MQAVIPIAGKSTRTEPLTINIPKALLKLANKTIIEHNLDQLEGLVDEVILIVGFKANLIKEKLGLKYKDLQLTYVTQEEQLGTGHALSLAKEKVEGRFLFFMGDDLYSKEDIKRCLEHNYSILVQETDEPERFGIVEEQSNKLKGIVEKPKDLDKGLANTALYVLGKDIFDIKVEKSERDEYEATDMITEFAKTNDIECVKVQDYWLPIGYAWNLLDANKVLLSKLDDPNVFGEVEPNATIEGELYLGHNSVIKNGSYIEGNVVIGNDCVIGPNCYIRGSTSIGNNCRVGNAVEIKNTIIMDNTNVGHLSYIGDSVIGQDSNMGAGTITANLKHDNANVKSMVKDQLLDSGRRKFGTIIADHVHTGIHTSIYPGRKIWPGKFTLPGEIVKKDVK